MITMLSSNTMIDIRLAEGIQVHLMKEMHD